MVDAVVPAGLQDHEVASYARMKRPDLFGAPAGVPRPDAITNPAQNPAQRYAANPWQVKESEPGAFSDEKLGQTIGTIQKYAVDPFEKMASFGKEVGGNAFETLAKQPSMEAYGMPQTPNTATTGISKGIGEAAGGMVTDPRNWPFLGSGAAKPLMQRAMSLGFSGMMGKGSYDTVKNLHDNWDTLTPLERWTMGTEGGVNSIFAAMSAAHGLMPHPDVISGRVPDAVKADEVKSPPPNPVPPEANAPDPLQTKVIDAVRSTMKPTEPTTPQEQRASQYSEKDIYEGRVPDSPRQIEANKRMAERNQVQGIPSDTSTPTAKPEESTQAPDSPTPTSGPVRTSEGPPVDENHPFFQFMRDVKNGVVYHGTTKELGDQIRANGIEGMSINKLVRRVADRIGVDINKLTTKQKEELGSHARSYNNQLGTASVTPSEEVAQRWAGKGGEFAARVEAILKNSDSMEEYGGKGEPEVLKGQLTESGLQNKQYQGHRNNLERLEEDVRSGELTPDEGMKYAQGEYRDIRIKPGDVKFEGQKDSLDAKLAAYNKTIPQHLDAFAQAKEKLGPDATMSQVLQEAAKIQNGGPKVESLPTVGSPSDDSSPMAKQVFARAVQLKMERGMPLEDAKAAVIKAGDDFMTRIKTEEITKDLQDKANAAPVRSTGFLGGYKPGDTIGQRAYWGVRKVNVLSRDENGSFTVKLPGGEIQKGVDSSVLSENPNLGQAGFIGFGRKKNPIVNPTNSIQELTQKIDQGLKDSAGDSLTLADKIKDQYSAAKDDVTSALHTLLAGSRSMWNDYKNPPIETDYKTAVGKWQGRIQRAAVDTNRFSASMLEKFPDKVRREAITNYLQVDGDLSELARREAATTNPRLKKGYELAQKLTPEERAVAVSSRQYFDNKLKEAMGSGLLEHGLANYVNQVWKKENPVTHKLMGDVQRGILQPKPSFVSQRIFDSYFEGEQQGFAPKDKDIGYLMSVYEQSFSTALGSRGMIHELAQGKALDGRDIVAPSGGGHTVTDPNTGDLSYLISPRSRPEDTGDYRTISHPALSRWTWADKDENGNPIFVKGDLLVHPDHYTHLNNLLGRSPIRSSTIGRTALNTGGFLKGTLLVGPFHQVQEGVHAVFHGVNPFKPRDIDFNDINQSNLVDHGLMIADFHAQQDFAEGAAIAGLWAKVPGIGPMLQKYNEYLFQDYIPRLKMTMAVDALERNQKRYPNLSSGQVHEITANQANAAFGELNYRMLGRSKLTQDVMRLTMLAPDFLEARMRFNAQALSPYGKEQSMALVMRGALGMWMAARITNKLLDDDYHFDQPFSIVHGGHQYTLRSLPGDDWHLWNDPRSFVYHRLNPFTTRPVVEALTGRDEFGRPKSGGEQIGDLVKSMVPLPAQGALNKYGDTDWKSTLMESAGVRRDIYRTPAQRLAHKFAMGNLPMDYQSRGLMQMANKIQSGTFDPNELQQAVQSGKISPRDLGTIMRESKSPPLLRDFKGLRDPAQAAQVFTIANDQEKAILSREFGNKMNAIRNLPPEKQKAALEFVQKIMSK